MTFMLYLIDKAFEAYVWYTCLGCYWIICIVYTYGI